MATKSTGSGFLSKMAKFVRHPTKDWTELDQIGVEPPESEPQKANSKQVLKEMIERKRRNDFVRGREFDQLRKLRLNLPVVNPERNGRPSFFLASTNGSNLDERASTIKKIDDIEAQMSKQWWKGKQSDQPVRSGPASKSAGLAQAEDSKSPKSLQPGRAGAGTDFSQTQAPQAFSDSESGEGRAYAATQPIAGWHGREPAARAAPKATKKFGNFAAGAPDAGGKEFSLSGLFSIELGDSLVDPDMEEAAIRFANGDDAGAEAGLLDALRGDKVRTESAEGWVAALFDLYRATGQHESFARFGMECAQRFGYSAPVWFSTPDQLRRSASAPKPDATKAVSATWVCPSELDLPALQALREGLLQMPEPWRLDWRGLSVITPPAAAALADLFAQWCVQPVRLNFSGADHLEKLLRSWTPAGDRQVGMLWWRLRLDALRIMRLQDEFELAALDFCIIHEVSPPPWEPVPGEFVSQAMRSTQSSALRRDSQPSQFETATETWPELTGEVRGDATETLDRLASEVVVNGRLVISCERLIRVDFSAAGSILNWVMARQAAGTQVLFRNVPCLVAAFFNVIGINEHAKVLLRTR